MRFLVAHQQLTIEGRTLAQVSLARGTDAVETALSLLAKDEVSIVSFNMLDEDIERLMHQPWTMTSSDGALVPFGAGMPHLQGARPRDLREPAPAVGGHGAGDGEWPLRNA